MKVFTATRHHYAHDQTLMTSSSRDPALGDDELYEVCPVSQAFEQIGSKWRLVVMHSIQMNGEQRFTELQENTGAESSTLSRVLEELEERDLVHRRLEDRPIATYYDLTEKGSSLAAVFEEIESWADDWTTAESAAFRSQP